MEWTDDAFVLAARPHGENALIVSLLARTHGRHAGLVQGGLSRGKRPMFEAGNRVTATWRARLSEHLGTWQCELADTPSARIIDDPERLAALAAAAAVADQALPEREPHPRAYDGLLAFIGVLDSDVFAAAYVGWELGLLAELGYGLDLSQCAATGTNDDLAYVSPRTGKAVSLSAGEPYRERLLPLPAFLIGRGEAGPEQVLAGLALTGHFLERHAFAPHNRPIPASRTRFVDRLQRSATISSTAST
ncbi:MAG: DNA repair protein RecO [Alphaproteobacteria bacterium]|nr:DNA repair protein RecO [Alphaproteobacteria bacterium]